MYDFADCNDQEREALDRMALGTDVPPIAPDILKSLADKNLVEDFEGEYIIPVMVWHSWNKFKEQSKWTPSQKTS